MKNHLRTLALLWIGLFLGTSAVAHAQSGVRSSPTLQDGQSATIMPDGRWLVLGGNGNLGTSAQRVDTASGTTTALPSNLTTPRAHHSATVLPDGSVWIYGGVNANGTVVGTAERYDSLSNTFQATASTGLMPRARHTATVLSDGRVLIIGGISSRGDVLSQVELWNPKTGQSESFSAYLETARANHTARLLATSPVEVTGGVNQAGNPVTTSEAFDTGSGRFTPWSQLPEALKPPAAWPTTVPTVVDSSPLNSAIDVAVDGMLMVRFSKPMAPASLNSATVTLMGPTGTENIKVVPVEGGQLLFVTPSVPLQPGADYTLFIDAARDDAGQVLPLSAIGFKTRTLVAQPSASSSSLGTGTAASSNAAATAPGNAAANSASANSNANDNKNNENNNRNNNSGAGQPPTVGAVAPAADDEIWTPGTAAMRGDWRARRNPSPLQNQPQLQAPPGVTALAGQVLFLDGKAAKDVTLRMGDKSAVTDATGRFLLQDVNSGWQILTIDGRTANKPGRTYGLFEARVRVVESGKTTVLPFTSWMPRINVQHGVNLVSPTAADTVVTTPSIPGLELHIPRGTVIRDRAGNIVTRVSITPIPVDRPPYPLVGVPIPVYFTVQPGAAHLQGIDPASARGARLIYPNYNGVAPGVEMDFWSYDPPAKGWYVYGQGKVSADGRQVVPNPGVAPLASIAFSAELWSHDFGKIERALSH